MGEILKFSVVATPRTVVSIACWRTVTHRAQGAFTVVGRFPAFFVHLCLHKEINYWSLCLEDAGILRGPKIGGQ